MRAWCRRGFQCSTTWRPRFGQLRRGVCCRLCSERWGPCEGFLRIWRLRSDSDKQQNNNRDVNASHWSSGDGWVGGGITRPRAEHWGPREGIPTISVFHRQSRPHAICPPAPIFGRHIHQFRGEGREGGAIFDDTGGGGSGGLQRVSSGLLIAPGQPSPGPGVWMGVGWDFEASVVSGLSWIWPLGVGVGDDRG